MRSRRFQIQKLSLDGVVLVDVVGLITVRQDEPSPGLFGVLDWSISATTTSHVGPDPTVSIEAGGANGRTYKGLGIVTSNASGSARSTALEIRGTGPLDGFDEAVALRAD